VKVAALRIRRRLGALIRDELSQTVTDQVELEEELVYLPTLFGK
jgi:hypothetical protein